MIGAASIAIGYAALLFVAWPWAPLLIAAHVAVMLLGMWRR